MILIGRNADTSPMKQAIYLFTKAKSRARFAAKRHNVATYVVRTRAGFRASLSRDWTEECWMIDPDGTVTYLPNGETIA